MNKYKLFTDADVCDKTVNGWALDYIRSEILNFCGCGTDDDVYMIRDVLKEMKEHWEFLRAQPFGFHDPAFYNEHRKRMLEIVGTQGAADFIYYWLDHKGFTEHGTSIPGWLEDKGEDLLHDLELAIKEDEDA